MKRKHEEREEEGSGIKERKRGSEWIAERKRGSERKEESYVNHLLSFDLALQTMKHFMYTFSLCECCHSHYFRTINTHLNQVYFKKMFNDPDLNVFVFPRISLIKLMCFEMNPVDLIVKFTQTTINAC